LVELDLTSQVGLNKFLARNKFKQKMADERAIAKQFLLKRLSHQPNLLSEQDLLASSFNSIECERLKSQQRYAMRSGILLF